MTARTLVLFTLLLVVGATTVHASPGFCSTATLKGSYGFLEQGTFVEPIPGLPLPPPLPYANVGMANLDGAGHVSGTYTGSFGGEIVSGPFTGTYLVNPDCSYTLQFTPSPFTTTLHHSGTISGDGMVQETHYIYTDANLVASGVGKRTPSGRCSSETFKGSYTLSGQGTDVFFSLPGFPISPPFPSVDVATLTADGKGQYSGAGTANFGGVSSPDTFTATYTVSRDCSVSIVNTDTAIGITIPQVGVITGEGRFQELRSISSGPGIVVANTFKPQ